MNHPVLADGGEDRLEPLPDHLLLNRADAGKATGGRDRSLHDGREGGLVELHDDAGTGHALGDFGDVRGCSLGQRGGDVGDRARVGQGGLE